jgi:hypothetical protein
VSIALSDFEQEALSALSETAAVASAACFVAGLHRWSGISDLFFTTPYGFRPTRDAEQVVGFFVKNLVLRVVVDPKMTLRELSYLVRRQLTLAVSHKELPYHELLRAGDSGQDHGELLQQIRFSYHDAEESSDELAALRVSAMQVDEFALRYSLNLVARREGASHRLVLGYDANCFTVESVRELLGLVVEAMRGGADAQCSGGRVTQDEESTLPSL